jgi:Zn-dependent M28 family amino/carboxypeptidase
MLGSPNYFFGIYNGSSSNEDIRKGSTRIQGLFEYFLESDGMSYDLTAFDGRSDYGPFIAAGIPAGGLFSGAEGEIWRIFNIFSPQNR